VLKFYVRCVQLLCDIVVHLSLSVPFGVNFVLFSELFRISLNISASTPHYVEDNIIAAKIVQCWPEML
jgi:hypothetical protein